MQISLPSPASARLLVYPARRLFSSPYPAPNLAPSCLVPATRFSSPRFILRSVLCPVQFRFACFVPLQTAFRAALTGRGDQRPSSFVILAREQPSLLVFLLAPVEIPGNFIATEIASESFRARLTLRKRSTESSNRKQSPKTECAMDCRLRRSTPRRTPFSRRVTSQTEERSTSLRYKSSNFAQLLRTAGEW